MEIFDGTSAAGFEFFQLQDFLFFERADFVLVDRDDGFHIRADDAVQQLLDGSLNLPDFRFEGAEHRRTGGKALFPQILHAQTRHAEQALAWLQSAQQRPEFAFQHIALDRLAVALAAPPVEAMVIGVMPVAALRPVRGERLAAMAAADGPAQREVFVEVFACGCLGVAQKPLPDLQMHLKADERRVIALAQGHAPCRRFDVSGIECAREDFIDLLRTDFAFRITRKLGEGFKITLHFGLRFKASRGVAFQRVLNDGGERLIPDENVPLLLGIDVPVTDACLEGVIAALDAGFHFLHGLTLVLVALQFALRGDDGFDELTFRRVLESEVQAFACGSILSQLCAQANVKLRVPCEALEVIEDDNVVRLRVFTEILDQRHHALALHEIATGAFRVAEHFLNRVVPRGGVLAAPVLLRAKPVAVKLLSF